MLLKRQQEDPKKGNGCNTFKIGEKEVIEGVSYSWSESSYNFRKR